MTINITPNMVQMFKIDGSCMETFPCFHQSCEITLFDGRKKKTSLDGTKIYALANVIAKNKIIGYDSHFDNYKNFKGNAFPSEPNNYSPPIPEEILSNIFKK